MLNFIQQLYSVSYQTQVLDCQFQIRMVWSSEALRIHGYSYKKNYFILINDDSVV